MKLKKWIVGLIPLSAMLPLLALPMGAATFETATSPQFVSSSAVADTVEVVLTEETVKAPETLDTEPTLVVSNQGEQAHGLAFAGPVDTTLVEELNAGQETTVSARLDEGTYTVYSPVAEDLSAEVTVK